jgi:hypothetical protein
MLDEVTSIYLFTAILKTYSSITPGEYTFQRLTDLSRYYIKLS